MGTRADNALCMADGGVRECTNSPSLQKAPKVITIPFPADHHLFFAVFDSLKSITCLKSLERHVARTTCILAVLTPTPLSRCGTYQAVPAAQKSSWATFLKSCVVAVCYAVRMLTTRTSPSIASVSGDLSSLTAPPFILSGISLTEFPGELPFPRVTPPSPDEHLDLRRAMGHIPLTALRNQTRIALQSDAVTARTDVMAESVPPRPVYTSLAALSRRSLMGTPE